VGSAAVAEAGSPNPQVLVLRDTRESGQMLEAAFAAGVAAAGGGALLAGVLPTPAASILVRRYGLDMAAVISASHNPWQDNGIKLFSPAGTKLDDETEARLEARLASPASPGGGGEAGRIRTLEGALDDYLRALASSFRVDLSGLHVVLDCANGATYRAAPRAFERAGARVEAFATEPDGRNINEGCGSTHIGHLVELIGRTGADVGFAFDGDGDRVLAVDQKGVIHDGDDLIALAARYLKRAGRLAGPGVAVTVMSNYGFHQAMAADGIHVETTPVGDRHVLEALQRRGWSLGGEQSGHVIAMDHAPSGDGVAAALLTLEALGGEDLAAAEAFHRLPQRLQNVEVADRAITTSRELADAVANENAALEGRGRVLVRASGTEAVVRVMVEAPAEPECEAVCERLVALIRELSS
jgi:phosphoglucosamine mutase